MSNGNGSAAPSCPVSHNGPHTTSTFGSGVRQPGGVDVANLPAAHDLRSAIHILNQMNNIIQRITRGAPQINNVYPATETGVPPPVIQPASEPPPQYAQMHWMEKGRGYTKQQAVNPDDKDQYVEISTLTFVDWADDTTGHYLTYKGQ
jgi:hypothetical protein